jgi:uncharacterized coiled-coil protein SlyX
MEELRQRLIELEMRFAFQQESIEELNQVVASCNLQIQQLMRENGQFKEMLSNLAPDLPESPDE